MCDEVLIVTVHLFTLTLVAWSCDSTPVDGEEEEEEEEEGEPQYGETLIVGAKYDQMRGFDPYKYFVLAQHMVGSTVFEGLAIGDWAEGPGGTGEWDFGGFYVPLDYTTGLLAESWDVSPDGTTVTFHLREGIGFHNKPPANSRELTSADVKYCWDFRCGTGSGFTERTTWNFVSTLSVLDEIICPDRYTVVFQASEFQFAFLHELCLGYYVDIYPREVIDTYGNMDEWENLCGTGPFMTTNFIF